MPTFSQNPHKRGKSHHHHRHISSVRESAHLKSSVSSGLDFHIPFHSISDIHRLAVEAVRKVDTSTASTLRDTEDLDLDDTDISHSEGEFVHKGDILNPETDPVLALLMQMQHQLGGFRQYDLPANRVQQVLQPTGRSMGEVNGNGDQGLGAVHKSVGEMSEGQVLPGSRGVTIVTPRGASSPPPPPQEVKSELLLMFLLHPVFCCCCCLRCFDTDVLCFDVWTIICF